MHQQKCLKRPVHFTALAVCIVIKQWNLHSQAVAYKFIYIGLMWSKPAISIVCTKLKVWEACVYVCVCVFSMDFTFLLLVKKITVIWVYSRIKYADKIANKSPQAQNLQMSSKTSG